RGPAAAAGRRRWPRALAVYRDRRMLCIHLLGFSSGLPLLLTLSTLSAWLATLGVSKTAIGLFALVGLPYSLKFLWAPAMDGLKVPVLGAWLGRRRSWVVVSQLALMGAVVALGTTDPMAEPGLTALTALLVAFFSASQDIVVDAYRVEILDAHEQGAGAAAVQVGYRLGMLASGAGALYLAELFGWHAAFATMAGLVVVGIATILANPEPSAKGAPPRPATRALEFLRGHVIAPFRDFLLRPGWFLIIVFILAFKFGDALAGIMANPFYIDIGFSLAEIASVSKIFGLIATLAGVAAGGVLVARVGIMASLLYCGILQALSNVMFALQAVVGHDVLMLTLTIAIENVSGGMGSAALVAYLSGLCTFAYTATQYALLSSLTAVGRTVLSSWGGWLADRVDWASFFLLTTVAALPGVLLALWLLRRGVAGEPPIPARGG
ncbi:MAG: AmpG family muropeptide MFS transporter, partial [Alphaproteobacteria bacterium]